MGKIENELTPEEVVDLVATLAKTPGGTVLRVIQDAAQKRGVKISLMGATTFRDENLAPYLNQLREASYKSQALAEALTDGNESGLIAGGRTKLAEAVLDFLMTKEVTPKQFSSLAATLQMLSSSNQGDKMTAARLAAFEAKEAERKEAKEKLEKRKSALTEKGGVSQEAIEIMEDALNLMG